MSDIYCIICGDSYMFDYLMYFEECNHYLCPWNCYPKHKEICNYALKCDGNCYECGRHLLKADSLQNNIWVCYEQHIVCKDCIESHDHIEPYDFSYANCCAGCFKMFKRTELEEWNKCITCNKCNKKLCNQECQRKHLLWECKNCQKY